MIQHYHDKGKSRPSTRFRVGLWYKLVAGAIMATMRSTTAISHLFPAVLMTLATLAGCTMAQAQERQRPEPSIKIETSLVTVPVIVSDRQNVYVPDLKKEEFTLAEDGVTQEIVFFSATEEPFQVALLLDTSSSTQEKLGQIQQAANHFVDQLKPSDRVKVISFDDEVREQSGFSSDRKELHLAINRAKPGQGTKLYDAVKLAINSLSRVEGRKAIVIFTDGVDWQSDSTSAKDNFEAIEESGIIVYPIRFDTRADTEEMLRNQQESLGETDLGLIFGGANPRPRRGTTPTTMPGDGGTPIPAGRSGRDDPYRLPVPDVQMPQRRYPPNGGGLPGGPYPPGMPIPGGGGAGGGAGSPYPPDNRMPGGSSGRYPDDMSSDRPASDRPSGSGYPGSSSSRMPRPRVDNTSMMLDRLYRDGEDYLRRMAGISGGRMLRADQLRDVPGAFARIAEELRHQYSLGYYPNNQSNSAGNVRYRKIIVRVTRGGDLAVRSRPGYRPSAAK